MKITLNMLLVKLKETYKDLKISPIEAYKDENLKGIRICSGLNQTKSGYLNVCDKKIPEGETELPNPLPAIICIGSRFNNSLLPDRVITILSKISMEDIFNTLLDIYHSFQDWDRTMHEALIQNKSLFDLLALSRSLIHNPILIYDLGLKLLAYDAQPNVHYDNIAATAMQEGYLPADIVRLLSEQQIFKVSDIDKIRQVPSPSSVKHEIIYLPFIDNHVLTGYCVMLMYHTGNEDYEKTMFRNFYEYASICMQQLNTNSTPSEFTYEYFLLDLINNPISNPMVIREHCMYAELPYSSNFYYLELRCRNYTHTLLTFIIHQMRTLFPDVCTFEWNHQIVFFIYKDKKVLPLDFKKDLEKQYNDLLGLIIQYDLICAVAQPFSEIIDIRFAHKQTQDVLDWLEINKDESALSCFYYFEEVYLDLLLADSGSKTYGNHMVPPALLALAQEDQQRDMQNILLLRTYFKKNCNITDTAAELSMHRNNVVYHLRRIQAHYHIDLSDASSRLLYQILLCGNVFNLTGS